MSRWLEFFQDDTQQLSSSRLVLIGAFLVASIVLAANMFNPTVIVGLYTVYLSGFGAVFVGGKCSDAWQNIKGPRDDSTNT